MTQATHWYNAARVREPGSVILREWMEKRRALRNSSQYKLSDREAMAEIFQIPAHAGPVVTSATAMQVTAVYACVSLIAGAVAMLPLTFYQRTGDLEGRKRIKHDLWWLFNEQPTPLIPAAVYWEYVIATRLLHGDGYALLVRDRNGRITESIPLNPLEVQTERERNQLVYYVNSPDLGTFGVHQDDMLHFFGFGFNGRRSLSVIKQAARQSIGTALAADEFAGKFFANGAQPSHAITYPGPMSQELIDQLRQQWAEKVAGVGNAHKPLVLASGGAVKELSLSAEDAQLLETRRFQVEDIARAFGVPPFMIGATDKTTSWGSGVEHMGQGFVTFTLNRELVRHQQEINRKCFRTASYFCEFNTAALLRGDLAARGDYYRKAIGGSEGPGWMTANQIRRLENDEPMEGGDKLYDPSDIPAGDKSSGAAPPRPTPAALDLNMPPRP